MDYLLIHVCPPTWLHYYFGHMRIEGALSQTTVITQTVEVCGKCRLSWFASQDGKLGSIWVMGAACARLPR